MTALRIVARDRMRDRVGLDSDGFTVWFAATDYDAAKPGWDDAPDVDSWMGLGTPEWFDRMSTIASAKAPATPSPGSCDGASTDGVDAAEVSPSASAASTIWPAPDPTTRRCSPFCTYVPCAVVPAIDVDHRPMAVRWPAPDPTTRRCSLSQDGPCPFDPAIHVPLGRYGNPMAVRS